jgi:hypothetical protein
MRHLKGRRHGPDNATTLSHVYGDVVEQRLPAIFHIAQLETFLDSRPSILPFAKQLRTGDSTSVSGRPLSSIHVFSWPQTWLEFTIAQLSAVQASPWHLSALCSQ